MGGDPTKVMITGDLGAGGAGFQAIQFVPDPDPKAEGRADNAMFHELEAKVHQVLQQGKVDKKIILAPNAEVPFDYVARTLDAVHKAHNAHVERSQPGALLELDRLARDASNAILRGGSGQQFDDQRDKRIQELRDLRIWKDVTFEAPPAEIAN